MNEYAARKEAVNSGMYLNRRFEGGADRNRYTTDRAMVAMLARPLDRLVNRLHSQQFVGNMAAKLAVTIF